MPNDLKGKKFLRVRNLANRWDCSTRRIYDLASKGVLRLWHPEGQTACRGILVDVQSILDVEARGYLEIGIADENKAAL